MRGRYPDRDHRGLPWPAKSRRAVLAGKRLAGDFVCLFAEFRGDWEWTTETFHWRLYGMPYFNGDTQVDHMLMLNIIAFSM
jgi:hypothetical protein